MVNGLGNGSLKVGSNDWYALHNKADNLELQIKAYNRGMMGVLDGEKAVTRSEQGDIGATRSGGYRGNVSLSANNDEPMYVGMNDEAASRKKDENNEEPVSIYTKGNSLRDSKRVQLLKENLDTTYYKILGMSVSEREAFASTNSAKNYFGNIEVLKNILAPKELSKYKRVLYGNDAPYEVSPDGYVIVKTAPFINESVQKYIDEAQKKYGDSIGKKVDLYNNIIYAIANAEPNSNLLVEYAKTFVGDLDYVWGGNDLASGADCSGFVESIYKDFGHEIPAWNAQAIVNYADKKEGTIISGPGTDEDDNRIIKYDERDEAQARKDIETFCEGLKPGYLILFDLGRPSTQSGKKEDGTIKTAVDHVVMYSGNGWIIEAYDEGTQVYYRPIEDLIFKEAGGENTEWNERMPLLAVRYLSDEDLRKLTVRGDA